MIEAVIWQTPDPSSLDQAGMQWPGRWSGELTTYMYRPCA
jgi:hypothetical protein